MNQIYIKICFWKKKIKLNSGRFTVLLCKLARRPISRSRTARFPAAQLCGLAVLALRSPGPRPSRDSGLVAAAPRAQAVTWAWASNSQPRLGFIRSGRSQPSILIRRPGGILARAKKPAAVGPLP
jgi:hypothetical protein